MLEMLLVSRRKPPPGEGVALVGIVVPGMRSCGGGGGGGSCCFVWFERWNSAACGPSAVVAVFFVAVAWSCVWVDKDCANMEGMLGRGLRSSSC